MSVLCRDPLSSAAGHLLHECVVLNVVSYYYAKHDQLQHCVLINDSNTCCSASF